MTIVKLLAAVCLAVAISADFGSAFFTNVYPKPRSVSLQDGDDPGEQLFLTPYIESGKIEEARKKAAVQHKEMDDIGSYAGFLTVNKLYNSNMFFWFFPAQLNPKDAPVVLWLQGGPGATSLFGLFAENGPFSVSKNRTLKIRKYSWHINHNLIYIDNPVGTGFSFTKNDMGYATNETAVGKDLYTALVQFFQLFHELRNNEFYVAGESYAGKYVPAVSYQIMKSNENAKVKINLQGLAMGNGLSDPENQLMYSEYLYQIGLLDFNGKNAFQTLEDKGREYIKQQKYLDAFMIFDQLIDGDLSGHPSLFKNLTGFDMYFNYLFTKDNDNTNQMGDLVQRADLRRAIHVGNSTFHVDTRVEEHLVKDILQSMAPIVAELTQHYRVLIYNGQLDIIVAYPLTENYLRNLKWAGAEEYKTAKRKKWWVKKELAGYSKTVGNLTEVLVRNAGHMVPADQPLWALDLITRFTHRKPF